MQVPDRIVIAFFTAIVTAQTAAIVYLHFEVRDCQQMHRETMERVAAIGARPLP